MLHFSSFVYHFSRILCSLPVPILGTSRAASSSQDWDHGKGYLLGFLSVTSFSDSSASTTLYILDYPFCCNWWNFFLCNSWVIILLKIYKPAFMLIKYPCSTRDLGPPSPSFCLHSRQNMETYWAHFLAQAFKTSLRGRSVPSWTVQVLCMGFIGSPRNPRYTALSLSLFLSFFSLTLVHQVPVCKDQQVAPEQGLGIYGIQGGVTGTYWGQESVGLWDKRLESPTIFLLYFIIYLKFKDFWFHVSK